MKKRERQKESLRERLGPAGALLTGVCSNLIFGLEDEAAFAYAVVGVGIALSIGLLYPRKRKGGATIGMTFLAILTDIDNPTSGEEPFGRIRRKWQNMVNGSAYAITVDVEQIEV